MPEIEIKYRLGEEYPPHPPQQIKLELPGWSGENHKHCDGTRAQPWHCQPFVEGSTYGCELIYTMPEESRVTFENGEMQFSQPWMKLFAEGHYGYCGHIDVQVPDEYSLRLEPHPRYFTDTTGTVPLCVPGHLQTAWWPRQFFIVFKAPWPGQEHIFRPGEPYCQFLVVPNKVNYKIREMTPQEARVRWRHEAMVSNLDQWIGKKWWVSNRNHAFNDKYKSMCRAWNKGGIEALEELFTQAGLDANAEEREKHIDRKVKRRLIGVKHKGTKQ